MAYPYSIDNWQLYPLNGNTGQAYMGVNGSEKVFIKCNASPFLAALSREGVTPRLVWIRRTSSGDTLTAQEWLDGQVLQRTEVGVRLDVIRTLRHIHSSESLKTMLYKVGGKEVYPLDLLRDYLDDLPVALQGNHYLTQVFHYLENHFPACSKRELSVCHGDVSHQNWLLSDEGRLYLVDWDSVRLADPMSDIGMLLGKYIVSSDWPTWLTAYGLNPTQEVMDRVRWYSRMHQLLTIKESFDQNNLKKLNQEILLLKEIFEE